MCQCFKCKKEFAETELTWVMIDNSLKLICDECKKEKELWYTSRGFWRRGLYSMVLVISVIKSMADIQLKYEDNVAGRYFVDEECIDCDLCRETAPTCFTRNEDDGYSFVFKQPGDEEEEELCKEAMENCPVEAIGDCGS